MEITEEMICGAVVTAVYEGHELEKGIECRISYFMTNRGFAFTLPLPDERLFACEIPLGAGKKCEESMPRQLGVFNWIARFKSQESSQISDERYPVRSIVGRKVIGITCDDYEMYEGEKMYDPQTVSLVFEDKSEASDGQAGFEGIGAAGLCFSTTPDDGDGIRRVNYFTIPKVE